MAEAANQVSDIKGAAEAVAGEMERAATMASELAGLFEQVAERVTEIEAKAEALYASAVSALQTFVTQSESRIDQVSQSAGVFCNTVKEGEATVATAMSGVAQAGQALQTSMQSIYSCADNFANGSEQASQAATDAVLSLTDELSGIAEAIGARADKGVSQLGELEQAATQWHSEWREFVDALDQRLDQSLMSVQHQIEDQVGEQLRQHVQAFLSGLETIANAVLHDPLTALKDDIVQTVREEFTALADAAIAAVDAKFKEIIREILDAKERGDLEERLMDELFEALRPIFDAVENQFHVVDSIARAVGAR